MNRKQAYWYMEKFTGCEIILLQAYSLEFHQNSVLDKFARNQNFYRSTEGFKPRGELQLKYFDGPWLGSGPGECWCGCKTQIKPPKRKWAGEGHARLIHHAKNMVEAPGPSAARVVVHVLQGGMCALCMEDLDIQKSELDHKVEVVDGGGGCWIDNLQNLCKQCHAIKSGKFTSRRFAKPKPIQPTLF